jgi:acetyl esterase/lipase
MTTSSCFLLLSIIAVTLTLAGTFRVRGLGFLIIPYFFLTWMITELSLFHVIVQLALLIWFVAQGVLTTTDGQLGFILMIISLAGLIRMHKQARQSSEVYDNVLKHHFGSDYLQKIVPERRLQLKEETSSRDWLRPFHMRRPGVKVVRNISYGDDQDRNILDIYLPETLPDKPCPVLFQIHGGGWIIGHKAQQALPLMYHMASRGWICVSINYRLSPKNRFPAHLIDTKKALAWTKKHIAEYGGDPNFIITTGGSAGGHLSSLLTLTANHPEFQPGFEKVDTHVQGCVPFYGVYDFIDRNSHRKTMPITDFLAKYVMTCQPQEDTEQWNKASPIANANGSIPPMLVVHGSHDSLAFVEEARSFVCELRKASGNPVLYAELHGAQHAFEIFHSFRAQSTLHAVTRFCEYLYSQHLRSQEADQGITVDAE